MLPHWAIVCLCIIIGWFVFWRIVLPIVLVLIAGVIAGVIALLELFPLGQYNK